MGSFALVYLWMTATSNTATTATITITTTILLLLLLLLLLFQTGFCGFRVVVASIFAYWFNCVEYGSAIVKFYSNHYY